MSRAKTQAAIEDVFATYRAAFEAFDVVRLAGFFAFPCQIASEAGRVRLTTLANPQAYCGLVTPLIGLYREVGVAGGRIAKLKVTEVSGRLAAAIVDWEVLEAEGATLYAFRSAYTLARLEPGWRIVAIAHDETTRLRAIPPRTAGVS